MPRFYFHLLNDIDAPDNEGTEFPDLNAARAHAVRNLRFIAAETINEHGKLVPGHRIDIKNEHGQVLDTVYVADVVTIEG